MKKEFLTPVELSERWGFSINTLATWRRKGQGPCWSRRGERFVIYVTEDIEDYEKSHPHMRVK